ncbi:prepilin peptidase [Georgenia ruanii]|uniref:prepilin peptidase n=1 Tax=Georgenia ruanii TaxID=348442 RepID=UPI001D02BB01|nr:prepilin peptidase [Georgenia ruanii]
MLVSALGVGGGAWGLGSFMRTTAAIRSRWLTSPVHVVLAFVLGGAVALLADGWTELAAFALLALACALLVVIDLAAYRLPDVIVGPMYPIFLGGLAVATAVDGDWGRLGRAVGAGVILAACYFVLAFISPAGLGLGDVKLSGLLGLFLGWLGWPELLLGSTAAFVLSAAFAIALLIARRADRHTAFPFGPWMVLGAVVGAALGPALAS